MKKSIIFFIMFLVIIVTGCGNKQNTTNKTVTTTANNTVTEETHKNNQVLLKGALHFTGLTPEEGDTGFVDILTRKHGTDEQFTPVNLSVKPMLEEGSQWMWNEAEEGIVYDVRAVLTIDNKEIAKSSIETVSAPANNVKLPLRVTWAKLPLEGRDKSFKKISGTIKIAGYLPTDSTLTIYAAKARDNSELQPEEVDDPQFKAIVRNVAVSSVKKWYWFEALGQIDYLLKTELYDASGKLIGTSDIVQGAVPEQDITMYVTSRAEAPIKDVALSGTVHLNGSYKNDSKIIVSVREDENGGFTQVDSFPAESDRDWNFKKAKNGIEYDVRAVLMHKNKEIARSSQKHTFAPAKNIKLKLNTGLSLSQPKEKPYLVECKKKGSKKYDAKITFPGIGDARSYWIKVGTSKHSGNRFNETERPKNTGNDLTIKLRFDKKKDYYVEYAYSYCKDCTTLDSYSDFSDHIKISCPTDN